MMPLYKTHSSWAEYICPLWNPSKVKDIKKVESIQRAFTSRINVKVKHLPYWERLKKLNLMSLQPRRGRYIIYKVIKHLAPNDIKVGFYQNERYGMMCKVPTLAENSKSKYQKLYDHSFHVIAAILWNRCYIVEQDATRN